MISDDLEIALQELDLLFNTVNTELIGFPDFGTNFEQFLWQMHPNVESLKSYINKKIYTETLILKNMDINLDVKYGEDSDTVENKYTVNIEIKNPNSGNILKRIYKLK